ncbi:MAG TPA: hypothetical protein VMN39_08600, partial [Longimicrobiaceae bacterium]|nr:hypothetical protein [Longimicrobiaceae bacterium]
GTTDVFLATQADECAADASPDGKWVAFVSNLSGTDEVYVSTGSAPPGAARPVQVSTGGGVDPRWSADGRELFYRSGNSILAVPVRTTPEFEPAGEPVELFSGPYDFTQSQNWDVGPDDTFLMIQGDPRTTSQFQVVFGWFEILAGSGG